MDELDVRCFRVKLKMLMKKRSNIILVLLLLCVSTFAQKRDETSKDSNSGIIYGKNHAYTLTAPKGWVLDNRSGVKQGLHAVFYPQGSSWSDGVAVMYANVWQKENAKQTVQDIVDSDIQKFKEIIPDLKVVNVEAVKLEKDRTAIVKYFTSEAKGQNFEAIAYINEEKLVVLIVLSSRTKKDFESSLPAFRELVGSYSFLTDKVVIEK